MVFFFAYTTVKNNAQNNGFTCAISFCLVRLPFPPPVLYILLDTASNNEPSRLAQVFAVKHWMSGWRAYSLIFSAWSGDEDTGPEHQSHTLSWNI